MTEKQKTMVQERKPVRGQVLGAFIASQRLQTQPQGEPAVQAPAVQGQRFTFQDVLARIDGVRLQFRSQLGYRPGMVMERRNLRRAEFLQAFSSPRTVVLTKNPSEEEKPAPPPSAPQPTFKCPWENCDFMSDSAEEFQRHLLYTHQRSEIKSY